MIVLYIPIYLILCFLSMKALSEIGYPEVLHSSNAWKVFNKDLLMVLIMLFSPFVLVWYWKKYIL